MAIPIQFQFKYWQFQFNSNSGQTGKSQFNSNSNSGIGIGIGKQFQFQTGIGPSSERNDTSYLGRPSSSDDEYERAEDASGSASAIRGCHSCKRCTFNDQRVCYNGHKRVHAVKFQSVVIPNGLIANLYGPMEGRRHDCALLRASGLIEQFEVRQLYDRQGLPFCLYGDPAYPLRPYLLCPFRGAIITVEEEHFNSMMSSVRECVEEIWQDSSNFCILRLSKELESSITSSKVLSRGGTSCKLPHMPVWQSDKQLFQPVSSATGILSCLTHTSSNSLGMRTSEESCHHPHNYVYDLITCTLRHVASY